MRTQFCTWDSKTPRPGILEPFCYPDSLIWWKPMCTWLCSWSTLYPPPSAVFPHWRQLLTRNRLFPSASSWVIYILNVYRATGKGKNSENIWEHIHSCLFVLGTMTSIRATKNRVCVPGTSIEAGTLSTCLTVHGMLLYALSLPRPGFVIITG